jgi:hypothetical protein
MRAQHSPSTLSVQSTPPAPITESTTPPTTTTLSLTTSNTPPLQPDGSMPLSPNEEGRVVDCAVGNDENGNETYVVMPDEVATDSDAYSDIENALPRGEVEPTCELKSQKCSSKSSGKCLSKSSEKCLSKAKKGFKIAWAVPVCEYSDMPQFQDDDYRYASISRTPPQQRPWISHKLWKESPQAHVSKRQENNQWRLRWRTRHDARARVEDKQVWNMAQARRSTLIMALEVDVATEELPSRWPTIVVGHQMFTFGICNLPPQRCACFGRCCNPTLHGLSCSCICARRCILALHGLSCSCICARRCILTLYSLSCSRTDIRRCILTLFGLSCTSFAGLMVDILHELHGMHGGGLARPFFPRLSSSLNREVDL